MTAEEKLKILIKALNEVIDVFDSPQTDRPYEDMRSIAWQALKDIEQ